MRPEILAPCGGFDSIEAAVRMGADAVYVGGKDFSARAGAKNFDHDELEQAVRYCHLHSVKIYRAVNTVVFDDELQKLEEELIFSARIGIDGLIIQDLGAAVTAAHIIPDMPLHASTQMTVISPLGARLAGKCGFVRVVAPRESTLGQIRAMCAEAETEVFIHGAQCMCLSGQCYMSAMIGSRSANRGACAQACRLPFSCRDHLPKDEYALSLKDMSLMEHLGELADAGVASFKIEGRMKRPEYTAAAVNAARKALDEGYDSSDTDILSSLFSRSGFTDGYLTGNTGAGMFGHRRYEDVTAAKDVLPQVAALYKDESKCARVSFGISIHDDEPVVLRAVSGDIDIEVTGDKPEKALRRSVTAEDVRKSLTKTGGTIYTVGDVDTDISDGLMVTQAALNALRRSALEMLDEERIKRNTPHYSISGDISVPHPEKRERRPLTYRYSAYDERSAAAAVDYDMVIIPLEIYRCGIVDEKRCAVSLPVFYRDEAAVMQKAVKAYDEGVRHFYAEHFSHLGLLTEMIDRGCDIFIHAGQGLNVTNSRSTEFLRRLGVCDVLLSFEMKKIQINSIVPSVPAGVRVFGRLPLMTVVNTPPSDRLTDRTGRVFPIRRYEGYSQILNCDILDVVHMTDSFEADHIVVGDDDPKELYRRLKARESLTGKGYTNGLYSRGIH